jgi:hypothetical protein
MIRRFLIFTALLAASAAPCLAQSGTAMLYDQGKERTAPLYTMVQTEAREGGVVKSVKRVYRQPDGQEAVIEEVTFANGRLASLVQDHKQKGRVARLDVKGGKLNFALIQPNGDTSTDSEDEPANLVTGFTLVEFLRTRWQSVLEGKAVESLMPIMDRKAAVRVNWIKIGETQMDGRPAVIVEAKPANTFLAMLAPATQVTLDRENGKMLKFSGRQVPLRKVDGDWKPLDADMLLKYDEPAKAADPQAADAEPARIKRKA